MLLDLQDKGPKRPHSDDSEPDLLKIDRIRHIAEKNGAGEQYKIAAEAASGLIHAWDTFVKWLQRNQVDVNQLDAQNLRYFQKYGRQLVDNLQDYQKDAVYTEPQLTTWFNNRLDLDSKYFVASVLDVIKTCQRVDTSTLAPFHDFIGELSLGLESLSVFLTAHSTICWLYSRITGLPKDSISSSQHTVQW